MDNKSRSSSNISLDSLEIEYKKNSLKQRVAEENVDTILVPLYEKDVLIKVPKRKSKQKQSNEKCNKKHDKPKRETHELTNYLVNKDLRRNKNTSYLEMFRKQHISNSTKVDNKMINNDIRSISPEFGDTERESIGNESNNLVNEFYNTESYNEIYYDKLMKRELKQYLDQSFGEILHLNEDLTRLPDGISDNNLRSISEISQPHRRVKSKIVPPIQNIRLGGLGPDMERIKPRLERARSLQRYSEKVRMENRLKIYKKELENEKKEAPSTRREPIQKQYKNQKDNSSSSYLVNKNMQEKSSIIRKICQNKSKSADVQRCREREKQTRERKEAEKNQKEKLLESNKEKDRHKTKSARDQGIREISETRSSRLKSSAKIKGLNTEQKQSDSGSPLQISFTVTAGIRPSSALKSLEEKHRMYQEKVKRYSTDILK